MELLLQRLPPLFRLPLLSPPPITTYRSSNEFLRPPPLPRHRHPHLCLVTRAASSSSSNSSSHFLILSDKELFAQCKMDTFRSSGPGGQHRNKTESAVRLKHVPTGLVSQAADDRSQHKNRASALTRLRLQIALKVRRPVQLLGYKPPPELLRILPSSTSGKGQKSGGQQIGPNHSDFPQGMQALLDLLSATGGSVSIAAALVGINTSILSKVISSDRSLQLTASEIQASKKEKPDAARGACCIRCYLRRLGLSLSFEPVKPPS